MNIVYAVADRFCMFAFEENKSIMYWNSIHVGDVFSM